jgi:hypothetical protein
MSKPEVNGTFNSNEREEAVMLQLALQRYYGTTRAVALEQFPNGAWRVVSRLTDTAK